MITLLKSRIKGDYIFRYYANQFVWFAELSDRFIFWDGTQTILYNNAIIIGKSTQLH